MSQLQNILHKVYGVGPVSAPPYAVVWAAESIQDVVLAKKEFKEVNTLRIKYGVCLATVPFGHKLF